jgi:hypothetical protein
MIHAILPWDPRTEERAVSIPDRGNPSPRRIPNSALWGEIVRYCNDDTGAGTASRK